MRVTTYYIFTEQEKEDKDLEVHKTVPKVKDKIKAVDFSMESIG